MWRLVISYINGLVSEASAELGNVYDGHVIQCPEHIFIKCDWTFSYSNFYTICQKIILTD